MNKIILFLTLAFLVSCHNSELKKPDDLLSKKEMINLIYDMHLANKTINILPLDSIKNKNYLSVVSQKYKTDSTRFKKSNEYYLYHITDYREIYDSVYARMDKELKALEHKIHIADSIKRANKPKKSALNKNLKKKIQKSKVLRKEFKPALNKKKEK